MPIVPPVGILNIPNATVRAGTIEANALSIQEISLNVTQSFDEIVQGNNTCETNIIISNTLPSTSATTGALTVAGGLGVAGNLYASNVIIQGVSVEGTPGLQNVTEVGPSTDQAVHFTNTTASTSATTGAVKVEGGLGVGGNVHTSSNLFVTGNVGIGTTEPTETLDIVGNLNLQKVSNTASIKLNSNVVTEFVRSKKLIKYPRVAMTAATTAGYTASASSENNGTTSGLAYFAFDGVAGGDRGYHSSGSLYSSGIYQGSAKLTGPGASEYDGEWIKLELPHKIKVTGVSFAPREEASADYFHRIPRKGYILGSNTGSDGSWELIHSFDNVTTTEGVTKRIDFVGTSAYYNNIAMVAEEIGLNASYGDVLNFAEMEYFGTPEYEPDADGTDVIVRSVPNVPNTDWLDVYWDGQDYTSMPETVEDKSGNELTGTPSGGVGFDAEYKAFTFDGVDDVITGTHGLGTGSIGEHSMSYWLKRTSQVDSYDYHAMIGTGGNTGGQTAVGINENKILIAHNGGTVTSTNTVITDNTWIHIAFNYNGGRTNLPATHNLYINGIEQGLTGSGSGSAFSLVGNELSLGRFNGGANGIKGSIANFRLFNRALSADEVWQLYAYQKEYFNVSPDVVTLRSGRLGLGTSEPRAVLDVKGDANFDSAITVIGTEITSFTGQHVCFPYGDMEQGLVVSANKNKYVSLNGVTTGLSAIRSNESLPIVSLSNVSNDGSVFGVVHELETGGTTRNRTVGGVNTKTQKMVGDNRVVVNSLGEGAMWVANTNGNLVSGDYITTSNVAGYGQRQDDDILHNYTVAKITMDCDFDPQEVPVQVIKEELDSYGRIQWEDHPTETEKAYKIRYLDTTGAQTDEANAVHIAAFVGCTYHCG
jgi:hypothetical protein